MQPTAAALPRAREHVLPTCPACGTQRTLARGATVYWCEQCRTEEALPVRTPPPPAKVAPPRPPIDTAPGLVTRPSLCLRCGDDRVLQGDTYVCRSCGSRVSAGLAPAPNAGAVVHVEPIAPPRPVLTFVERYCQGEDCKLQERELRPVGKLVCPVCGDTVPYPDVPVPAPIAAPVPAVKKPASPATSPARPARRAAR